MWHMGLNSTGAAVTRPVADVPTDAGSDVVRQPYAFGDQVCGLRNRRLMGSVESSLRLG